MLPWIDSRYSSESRSSDESGQLPARLPRGARTFVRVKLLEVVLAKGRLYPEVFDRMRTMTALGQFGRTSLHHEAITSIT